MNHIRIVSVRMILALAMAATVAGCGGGGSVTVATAPVIVAPVLPLDLLATRIGPEEVQLDWSDDPGVAVFVVTRDGFELARVPTLTLIDASVIFGDRYCYQVSGLDHSGVVISVSNLDCLTIFP